MQKPVIIGAGISGLVAALELERMGYLPIILEATDKIGGRVKTDDIQGYPLDYGFQVLLTAYPEAQRYLDYIQLDLIRFKPGSIIFNGGKKQKFGDPRRDLSFLLPTVFANVGSVKDKFLILKLSRRLNANSINEIFHTEELTTMQYLKNFGFSEQIITHFFKPFFAGIFLEEELNTSSRMFEFVYKMFGNGYAAIPNKGMQAIPQQLAQQLTMTEVRLNTRVKRIHESKVYTHEGQELETHGIIIATDPYPFTGEKKKVEWKSCYNIYLEAENSTINEPLIGLLSAENTLVNNFHFLGDVFGKRSEQGIISVTVVNDHSLSQDRMVEQVKNELLKHCSIQTGKVIKVHHIQKALPNITNLNNQPKAKAIRLNLGVYCCGDYLANGSLNAAMASGRAAAQLLAKELNYI